LARDYPGETTFRSAPAEEKDALENMAQFGDNVTLVNRTSKSTLTATWDGMHYHFEPGETPNVPREIAIAAYKQNPIHGTEDPLGDPDIIESLFGIVGYKHPFGNVVPIEQSAAGERINRSLVMGLGTEAKRVDAGGPSYFEAKLGADKVNLQDDADAGADNVAVAAPAPATMPSGRRR
jgi:hypothetical protein